MTDNRAKNRALVQYLLLPTIFLTVALLGGFRVRADAGDATPGGFLFIAPPLVTLVLAVILMLLFVRGRLIEWRGWLSGERHPLSNVAGALTLGALFFASAQSFNSVLPEAGLLRWMFSFFFLWTLWNNLFSSFDARRLVRSLAALFGTAFIIKHMLLASLYAPDGGWLKRIAAALLEGVTLGATLDGQAFAPATGYVSFFTIALYVGGLILLPRAPAAGEEESGAHTGAHDFVAAFRHLPPAEQRAVRHALSLDETEAIEADAPASRAKMLAGAEDDLR